MRRQLMIDALTTLTQMKQSLCIASGGGKQAGKTVDELYAYAEVIKKFPETWAGKKIRLVSSDPDDILSVLDNLIPLEMDLELKQALILLRECIVPAEPQIYSSTGALRMGYSNEVWDRLVLEQLERSRAIEVKSFRVPEMTVPTWRMSREQQREQDFIKHQNMLRRKHSSKFKR